MLSGRIQVWQHASPMYMYLVSNKGKEQQVKLHSLSYAASVASRTLDKCLQC